MQEPIAAKSPPRRPSYRLHLSTWLTLPLGLVVAVFVVVPGGVGQYPERSSWVTIPSREDSSSWDGHSAIVHGWPLPYLWRTPEGWKGDAADAAPSVPWQMTDCVHDSCLSALVVDVAVMAACLAAFVSLVEWRRRRRRLLQCTLRELLALASLAAILLGWWNHQRASAVDAKDLVGPECILVPRFPLWLRTVVGDEKLSHLGLNKIRDSSRLNWFAEDKERIQFLIDRFPGQIAVATGDSIGLSAEPPVRIERLERMECGFSEAESLTRTLEVYRGHPHLNWFLSYGLLDHAQMSLLTSFPRLESLTILGNGCEEAQPALTELRDCRNLRELQLRESHLAADGVDSLRELKQLTRLSLRGTELTDAGASLARLTGLEELDVSGTTLSDSDVLQLRTLPSLRRLNIAHTQMTSAGLRRLLDPSAGPLAGNLEQICISADLIDDALSDVFKNLPRLRLICVTWATSGWQLPGETNYEPAILKLRGELPNRDVVDLRISYFEVY